MNKLKIIIVANDTTYTYNLRKEIMESFISDGHEVIVVAKSLLFQEEIQALGCRLIDIETNRHGTNPLSDFSLLLKYKKIFKKEKPDIVLTYNIKPNVYGGIACRMLRIHYLPNITGLGTAVEYPGLMQKLSTRLYKIGVATADCVFFQNDSNLQFFIDYNMLSKTSRTRVLPGSGVSLKVHKEMPYPEDNNRIHFLFIARVMKEKGADIYLNAANRIHKRFENAIFHICGRCDDTNYLNTFEKYKNSGYIIYHGEQKDMNPFFEMAHCIVHPSYYPEGMSNVLLEAAAHCRPIIATDRAGCRETVCDGKSGFIIPIKDENALVEALEKFLSLNWIQKRDMGLAGRAKIEREFDRQLVVNAYREEITKVLR